MKTIVCSFRGYFLCIFYPKGSFINDEIVSSKLKEWVNIAYEALAVDNQEYLKISKRKEIVKSIINYFKIDDFEKRNENVTPFSSFNRIFKRYLSRAASNYRTKLLDKPSYYDIRKRIIKDKEYKEDISKTLDCKNSPCKQNFDPEIYIDHDSITIDFFEQITRKEEFNNFSANLKKVVTDSRMNQLDSYRDISANNILKMIIQEGINNPKLSKTALAKKIDISYPNLQKKIKLIYSCMGEYNVDTRLITKFILGKHTTEEQTAQIMSIIKDGGSLFKGKPIQENCNREFKIVSPSIYMPMKEIRGVKPGTKRGPYKKNTLKHEDIMLHSMPFQAYLDRDL
jgi:hypothetical protein